MRFFLDSNVLVSGIAFSGIEQWLLRATFRGEHRFVIFEDVQREAFRPNAQQRFLVSRSASSGRRAGRGAAHPRGASWQEGVSRRRRFPRR